jgi:hypothetical protein
MCDTLQALVERNDHLDKVTLYNNSSTPTRDSLALTSAAHVAGPATASLRHIPSSAAKARIVNLGIHCY